MSVCVCSWREIALAVGCLTPGQHDLLLSHERRAHVQVCFCSACCLGATGHRMPSCLQHHRLHAYDIAARRPAQSDSCMLLIGHCTWLCSPNFKDATTRHLVRQENSSKFPQLTGCAPLHYSIKACAAAISGDSKQHPCSCSPRYLCHIITDLVNNFYVHSLFIILLSVPGVC